MICYGVENVYRSGTPGTLLLYGADAFPIFGSQGGEPGLKQIAAAGACIAPVGGKLVAFAHNGYISGPAFGEVGDGEQRQFVQLMAQLLRWCGSSTTTIPVAFVGGYTSKQIDSLRNHAMDYGTAISCVFNGNTINEADIQRAIQSNPQILFFNCNDAQKLICGYISFNLPLLFAIIVLS